MAAHGGIDPDRIGKTSNQMRRQADVPSLIKSDKTTVRCLLRQALPRSRGDFSNLHVRLTSAVGDRPYLQG